MMEVSSSYKLEILVLTLLSLQGRRSSGRVAQCGG